MKKLVLLLVVFLFVNCLKAIDNDTLVTKKNSVFFELGGKGLLYSINYDRTIPIYKYLASTIGMGFTYISFNSGLIQFQFQVLSPEIGLELGNSHKAEIGYSKAILLNYTKGAKLQTLRIGYRYQKPEGGFLFRASYCPFYTADWGGSWFQWAGVSFGYVF